MKKILFIALAFLATVGIAKATLWDFYNGNMPTIKERQPEAKNCGISDYSGEYDQNIIFEKCLRSGVNYGELSLGGTLPVAGSTYSLAGSGVSSSATSITLQSFTIPQSGQKILDSDLSDTFYATLEPGSRTRQEIVACTTVTQNAGGTATLSGCSRGMSPITPYTASTTLAFVHAGGSQVILSDPPQLFNEFTAKSNAETVTGIWTFNNLPKASTVTTLATTSDQFATKYYVDNVGAGGFTASNVGTNYGLKALGTAPETIGIDLASLSGLRFDNAYNLQVATSSGSGIYVDSDNAVKLATSTNITWTGTHNFSGNTTMATTTIAGGHLIGDNFGGNGIDGALTIGAGSTTTLSFASATYLVKNYTSLSIPNTASLSFSNSASGGSVAYIKVQGDATIGGYINLEGMGAAGGAGGAAGAASASGGSGGAGASATLVLDDATHGGGGGGGGNTNGSAGTAGDAGTALSNKFLYTTPSAVKLTRGTYMLTAGHGGGGGGAGASGAGTPTGTGGGAGGNGGGVLILEVGGTLTFTGSIDIDGAAGANGGNGGQAGKDASGGGGGGGSAGMAIIVYNYISTNTGVISAKGGSGGNGGVSAQAGIDGESGGGGGGAGGTSYTAVGGVGGAGGGTNGNGVAGTGGGAGAGGGGGGGMGNSQNASTVAAGGGSSTDSNHYLIIKAF